MSASYGLPPGRISVLCMHINLMMRDEGQLEQQRQRFFREQRAPQIEANERRDVVSRRFAISSRESLKATLIGMSSSPTASLSPRVQRL